jgi:protein TonB
MNFTLQLGLTTVVDVASQAPPGLRCFSVFGAFKADGTPFTEADCPGGTIVTGLSRPSAPVTVAPGAVGPDSVMVVHSTPVTDTQPAAPAAVNSYPIRVGGDVRAGRLLSHPNPTYPAEARNKGIEGAVVLSGKIATDGQLRSLKIIGSSNPLLETSVLETLQNWRYEATLLNLQPFEVPVTITLNFTLGR